jgi:S1-C subfamily serine protease
MTGSGGLHTTCYAWLVFGLLLHAQTPQQLQPTAADVVKRTVDSVVLIVVNDAFGKAVSQGSGFIISPDGKIITNHHVIEGGRSMVVKLNNGAFFPVEAVLADNPDRDLAVIKVAGKNLPTLPLASLGSISVGDRVVAIGSPLGLENSVSDGIVSGFRDDGQGRKWVQTTAPASPGNSGGPILTMDGRVVGVITLSAVAGQNLNFAVPSDAIAAELTSATSGVSSDTSSPRSAGGETWTSLTSGHDYKLKFDGDYLYVECVNIPTQVVQGGGFTRSELKKVGDKWVGKSHSHTPCQYYNQVRWCSLDGDIEISKIATSRIEGRATGWTKFNCRRCQPEGVSMKEFTWIPK